MTLPKELAIFYLVKRGSEFYSSLVFSLSIARYAISVLKYKLAQLTNLTSYTVLSSGNNLPATPVSTGDIGIDCNESGEMYEGMLVSFSNAVVQSIDSYDNLYVDDGSGLSKVGDYFFNFDNGFWPDLNVGDTIDNVQGVVHYYFDEYVI